MNQKYSTTLFLPMNEIVNQPAKKNNFYLSFVTILVSVVAGSHTAISQTVSADQNEHRPLDRLLVAHQHLTTQESGSSKNFNLPNRLIAGDQSQTDLNEYHDKHYSGKPTGDERHRHRIMPKLPIDDGSGGTKHVKDKIPMPKPRIDDGSGDGNNPSKTAPKH
jgi:hypothetical protein